jgi:hypothetical protein
MLSKEEFILLHHYLEEGLSKTAVANKLGINRRTVHRYFKSEKTAPGYQSRPPDYRKCGEQYVSAFQACPYLLPASFR